MAEEEEEVRVAKRGQISTAIPTKMAEEEEEEEEVRVAKRGKISTAILTKMAEEEEEVRVAKRRQISTAIPTKMAEEEEEVRVAKRRQISTAIPTKMAEEEEEEEEEVRVAKRGKISTAIVTKMAEEEEVSAFLNNLKTLNSGIYLQKDVLLNSSVVRNGMLDRSEALRLYETHFRQHNGRASFQGMDVGNVKNLSHDDLNKITNNFSDCIWKDRDVIFYHGVMDDGQEVTVKTLEFSFPPRLCKNHPRSFHDEIVLLERSPLKSCPFLVKLNGFCFEKKLALVYDLKYKRNLKELCRCDEFGWKERMKVANDYALLLKTLTMQNLDLFWTSDGIAIDEEYNIKVMNFRIGCRTNETYVVGAGFISDDADFAEELAKAYVYEFGALLVELIVKWVRDFDHEFKLRSDILEMKEGSEFHKALEALEIDADTGAEITKLIGSCMHDKPERPYIDYAISELKRIVGS